MVKPKVIFILGSKSDLSYAVSMGLMLEDYDVDHEYKVASAHKTPEHLLKILKAFENSNDSIVYITVAGLSDALSGFVAGFTKYPVIACPPDSEKYGWSKVFSSVMTPRGVAVSLVFKPENAALAAVKILALSNPILYEKIEQFKRGIKKEVINADLVLRRKKASELDEV